jgi:dTDP-glucose 4,6-dehydratase
VVERFGSRHVFTHTDIRDAEAIRRLFAEHEVDTVVHFAAESHVDRSIDGPLAFVDTNVRGTAVLLEAARAAWQGRKDVRFHHVSTDEVFGSLGQRALHRGTLTTRRACTSASKARPITSRAPGTAPTACR